MPPHRRVLLKPPLIKPGLIRSGRDADAAGIIALIGRCWADYPGCILDLDREEPHLRALASYYLDRGGMLWVTDGVAGMAATLPRRAAEWEVCRVYVHPDQHGAGLAHALLDHAEAHARSRGAARLALWTDTRFHRAHRFYERRGYTRTGEMRALHDLSQSSEYGYAKTA